MSVRVILTTTLTAGLPSGPFTSPSIAVIWANDRAATQRTPAAARARLRNFIKPPNLRDDSSIKLQYTVTVIGRNRQALIVEKLNLILFGGLGLPFFQGAADDAEHFDGDERGARHPEALLVAEGIGRDHGEAGRVQEHEIVGDNPLHTSAIAEAEIDPEAFGFGARLENVALGTGGGVKFLDKTDEFDGGIWD